MGKTKSIKAMDVVAVKKQSPIILATYKPVPKFGSGCKTC